MEYRKQQFQTYEEFVRQFPCDYSMPFARGGHGELYRGIDTETNDEVAIKRRLYSVGDDALSLEKEYTNTQEVPPSRFTVRYLYYGRYPTPFGTYEYLVMRYYRDGNLTNHVLPWHQLSDTLQRRFVEEFLRGLDHLHVHHIIHRDIKPENVLLVRYADGQNAAYRPVLADFGISKILSENPEIARTIDQNSMRVGTVTYMAPEQLRGDNIRYNSDLWSFGIILYEIITGKHMIARRSFPEQQREEAYDFWRNVDEERFPDDLRKVPQPYQQIIRRCLVVDAKKRAQRSGDLLDLLAQPAGAFEPVASALTEPATYTEPAITKESEAVPESPAAEPVLTVPDSQLTQQLTEQLDLPDANWFSSRPIVTPLNPTPQKPVYEPVVAAIVPVEPEPVVLPVSIPEPVETAAAAMIPSAEPAPVAEVIVAPEPVVPLVEAPNFVETPKPAGPAAEPISEPVQLAPVAKRTAFVTRKSSRKTRVAKTRRSLKPLSEQGKQFVGQTLAVVRKRWQARRMPNGLVNAYRGAVSRAASGRTTLRRTPSAARWLPNVALTALVFIGLSTGVLSSASMLPEEASAQAASTLQQSESYIAALDRFNQHRINYIRTGALDRYLWTFIHCNPTYEDSLTHSAFARADSMVSFNKALFPNYEGNPNGLKRLEIKRLLVDKISFESQPHGTDELSCQPRK